jgi:hypothetical protein
VPERRNIDVKILLVALLCITGSASGAYLLYSDLNARGGAGIGKPMALVERREAKVRRKAGSSYAWSNVDTKEDLYKKDSLQTGPSSAATVKFNDGSMLEIGENSLVVIDDIQNIQLNFQRGSLIVRRKDGSDSKITIDKDGKAKVEELPIRLMAPDPLTNYWVPERGQKSVKFAWEPRGENQPESYSFQISNDKAFRADRTKTVQISDTNVKEANLQLAPGRYYWRVAGKGAQPSEARQIIVSQALALKPTSPSRQKLSIWGADSSLPFKWATPQSSDDAIENAKHEIEISTDPEFKTKVLSQAVAADSGLASLKNFAEGQYFWRIQSRYGDFEVASQGEKFSVEKARQVAIELGKPDAATSFETRPQVLFTWDADADAEFQIELQDAKGRTVLTNKAKAKTFSWNKPDSGTFKWRVVALAPNGEKAGETEWRQFAIFEGKPVALKSPGKNQEIYYWEDPSKIGFEWSSDPVVKKEDMAYLLEVATDADFKSGLVSKKTDDESLTSKDLGGLRPGAYFWRVRVVDSSGQSIKTSEVARFAYGPHPVLSAPLDAVPAPGAEFNVLDEGNDPVISWKPVEGAENYEITVYAPVQGRNPASDKQQHKVYYKTSTDKLSATVKGLKEGKYFWTIRTIDRMKRAGDPMPPKWFTVTYGEVLGAPESTSAEVQ